MKIFHILILFICCSFLEAQNNYSELSGTWLFESMTTITNATREEITIVYKDKKNIDKNTLIKKSDIIILATPHKAYKRLKIKKNKTVVDIWGLIENK